MAEDSTIAPRPDGTEETLGGLFRRQAQQTPDALALTCGGETMTYAQLDILADERARYLRSLGVCAEQFVGVVMDHGFEMIADILGVLKAGAAYVPMEPSFPPKRIDFIIHQAGIRHLFTQRAYFDIFEDTGILIPEDADFSGDADTPLPVGRGTDAAYVLYTSGTTGEPKGVVVEQRNVCNYVRAFQNEFHPTPDDRMLQNSVCTFDIFVEEVFPILLSGGTLVIATQQDKQDIESLTALMEREGVTMVSGFPYLLADLNAVSVPPTLRLAISGGDVLRKEHVDNLLGKVAVYNTYGPTETTVCVAYYHYTDPHCAARTVPVGKAVLGTQMFVLDADLQPTAPGRIGEIAVAGNGVSRGYQGNTRETATHFVDNPFGAGKLYLTGDLGRLLPDGNVEFLKRKDDQTMIDGRRVEPSEVENVMYRFPGIEVAVVKPLLDDRDYPYLVGYYRAKSAVNLNALRRFLSQYLPDFMIPESFLELEVLPKTPNGKIDRGRLPFVPKKEAS